jgi:hypothetical protein
MIHEINPVNNVLYWPNNIDIRICPKNGMSTLKEALRRALNQPYSQGHEYRNKLVNRFADQFDIPYRKGSYRIAVRRDPIDRFKSACEFIQQQRAWFIQNGKSLPDISLDIDEVIDSLENGKIKNNHFYPQTHYMGQLNDYDMVYHINELPKLLDFLQEACKIERSISALHENKTTFKLYNDAISPVQLEKLRKFYSKDFKNGWCKQEDRITV